MSPKTTRRVRTFFMLMLVCIPVALSYEFIESSLREGLDGRISFVGVFVGIVLALPLALLEESGFDERMRRLPFLGGGHSQVPRLRRIAPCRIHAQRPADRVAAGSAVGGLLGVEAGFVVTHNARDFDGVEERFGIRVITPGAFLEALEERDK